jgi:hypothetical protein
MLGCIGFEGASQRRPLRFAPAQAVQHAVDGAERDRPAHAGFVGALQLGDGQGAGGLALVQEWLGQRRFFLGRHVLVAPPTLGTQIEHGIAVARPARMDGVHRGGRPAQHQRDLGRRAPQGQPHQHALDALVLMQVAGPFQALAQARDHGGISL